MIESAYCSSCFDRTDHFLIKKNYLRRNVYKCGGCGRHTVQCRYCSNMATTGSKWDSELCAEHDGSIASFARLNHRLKDLADFKDIFKRDSLNIQKAGKVLAIAGASAAIIIPGAVAAAPAIGGLIGTAGLGLSGAAATNAGLALLGGGSIAAGGAGMAGGVSVVTAVGAALGGAVGGAISNSYFGDVDGFDIIKIRDGYEPSIIVIDGFLTQAVDDPTDWREAIASAYPDNACYYVRWESKRLREIGSALSGHIGPHGVSRVAASWVAKASKTAAKRIGPLAWFSTAASLASNPWSVAMVKAQQTGVLLADILSRTDAKYILCGHSLGARVIHYCLQSLSTRKGSAPLVIKAHLLGGAVGNDSGSWRQAMGAVDADIVNYHSDNDDVLRWLYSTGTLLRSSPVGRSPIVDLEPKVKNVNVSKHVSGHSSYKHFFASFIRF